MLIFSVLYLKQIGGQTNVVKYFALNHGVNCWNWSFPICIQVTQMINGIASRRTNISSAPCKPSIWLALQCVTFLLALCPGQSQLPAIQKCRLKKILQSWRFRGHLLVFCATGKEQEVLELSPSPQSLTQQHHCCTDLLCPVTKAHSWPDFSGLGLKKEGQFIIPEYVSPENWLQLGEK